MKQAILEHYNVNSERCRKQFRAYTWTKDQEPLRWVTRGMKLAKRWLLPDEGVDKMINRIAVEQFLNGLPQEMRIWVASQDPDTPERVAQLIESYDSAIPDRMLRRQNIIARRADVLHQVVRISIIADSTEPNTKSGNH